MKKYIDIPTKDENGILKDKVLRIVEGGQVHKKLLAMGVVPLPKIWIIDKNK